MEIIQYFNLPFDCFVRQEDLKYRFDYFKLTQIEKNLLVYINSFCEIAVVDNQKLGIKEDEDSYYDSITIYNVDLNDQKFLSQIVGLLYKIIRKPAIFIISFQSKKYVACGNVNYMRKQINYEEPIKYISASIDEKIITDKSQRMLKCFNYQNMRNVKTVFDFIFNVFFAISSNQIKYLKKSAARRYINHVFYEYGNQSKIFKLCYIKQVGNNEFIEEEELWRNMLTIIPKENTKFYHCIDDIKVDIKRTRESFSEDVVLHDNRIADEDNDEDNGD